jgi:glycosyltransferase involved in cell wall biosynthesis
MHDLEGDPGRMARSVHQLLPALHRGDAVGNEALVWRRHLRAAGLASDIFAGTIDHEIAGEARLLEEWPGEDGAAVTVFHYGPGSLAGRRAAAARGPLVLRYHNVTPASFLAPHAAGPARLAARAREELSGLARRAALGLGVSEFNRRDLIDLGCPSTTVLPLAVDLRATEKPRSPVVRRLYDDGRTNVLVVGRLAPNKKIEDAVATFGAYQGLFDPGSRLLVVGSDRGLEGYGRRLRERVRRLQLERVVFLGHVDDDDLRALYSVADVLLGLSEHEGFCAPILEAMQFGVPVVAYDAGAVRETLGGAGVLLREKRPEVVAGVLDELLRDRGLRAAVTGAQRSEVERRRSVDYPALLLRSLEPIVSGVSCAYADRSVDPGAAPG